MSITRRTSSLKMKKLVILFLLLPLNIYSQNLIRLHRTIRPRNYTRLSRTITTSIPRGFLAFDIAKAQSLNGHTSWKFINTQSKLKIIIDRKLKEHSLKSPKTIYGPYNYVRTFSKISRQESLIYTQNLTEWRQLHQPQGFNGAHHLVNKYTIKLIHEQMKENGRKFNLSDCQNNAPAIFHPLHGNPKFKYIFHNPEQQLAEYNQFGMKVVVSNILNNIEKISIENGLGTLPELYKKSILLETEFWCKEYGLKF